MSLRHVCQHFRCIGVHPKESARFTSLISKWVRHSGPEWTVDRLKALRQSFMDSLSTGSHYTVPIGWGSRVNRKGEVIFRDRLLHSLFTNNTSERSIARAELFLRSYQGIILPERTLTERQRDKFESAVMQPPKCPRNWVNDKRITTLIPNPGFMRNLQILTEGERADALPSMLGSAKSSPVLRIGTDGTVSLRSRKRNDVSAEAAFFLDQFRFDEDFNRLWHDYPEIVRKRLGIAPSLGVRIGAEELRDLPVGTITALQEPGCKVRWIANPTLAIQALGEPLKVKLQRYSKLVFPSEIAVDDQDAGRRVVQEWLIEGKTVFSYDLTSFTDRFPLEFQQSVLRTLVLYGIVSEYDFEIFDIVAKKTWVSRPTGNNVISWAVGQPLGFGPSFPLATLSHAAILNSICRFHGVPNEFVIVGDDVVISNKDVASSYTEIMALMEVEINKSKTVISNEHIEFLGKLICKDGWHQTRKVKPIEVNLDTLMSAMNVYGPRSLRYLQSPWARKFINQAFLPQFAGGLGWTPHGMKHKDYISALNTVKLQSIAIKQTVTEFTGLPARSSITTRSIEAAFNYVDLNSGIAFDSLLPSGAYESVLREVDKNLIVASATLSNLEKDYLCPSINSSLERADSDDFHSGNSYVHIVDKSIQKDLTDLNAKASPASSSIVNTIADVPFSAMIVLNAHGYVSNNEVAYTAASHSKGFENEPNQSAQSRIAKKRLDELIELEGDPSWESDEEDDSDEPRERFKG